MRDINKLLSKMAAQEKRILDNDIFAPYIKGGSKILLRVNGVIYKLKTPRFKHDGFGIFNAINGNDAKLIRDAELYESEGYLHLLPKVDFILVYKMSRWLAYPANINSFKHRFNCEPSLITILMADNIEVMDTIEARFDGVNFWFDRVKFGTDIERKENLRNRLENQQYMVTKNLQSGLTPEEIKAFKYASEFHKEANKSNLEKRLEKEFGCTGAAMDKFIERGKNVEVQWKDGGNKYTSVLNKDDLSVVTAGICLSGGDKLFDLQSLVTVCREGSDIDHINHVGHGGMSEQGYWNMYGDRS